MSKIKPAPYTAKRIGYARLATELSPIFVFAKMEDGTFGQCRVNSNFIEHHNDDFDLFLLNNAYCITNPDVSDDPYIVNDPTVADDPFGEDIPDPDMLMLDVVNTLNGQGDDPGEHAYDIVDMLYHNIYDDQDLVLISNAKARYLCDTLSALLDIEYFERGDDADIDIKRLRKDVDIDTITGFGALLNDLGYLPHVPLTAGKNKFMQYVEDYINTGNFSRDGFAFGEAVLRAYDENIAQIDWFDHSDEDR